MTRGDEDCPVTRRVVTRPPRLGRWLPGILAVAGCVALCLASLSPGVTAQQAPDSPLPTPAVYDSAAVEPAASAAPPPAAAPRVLITELMIAPRAVGEEAGEWIEVTNLEAAPVNLHDWTLAYAPGQTHLIAVDLWLAPGSQAVLARNGDSSSNGGVTAAYVYVELDLSNETGEVALWSAERVEVDRVAWVAGQVISGHSLERMGYEDGAGWAVAWERWPGAPGNDFGSPGAPYRPAPTPTATVAPAITETPTFMPSATPSATPSPTPPPSDVPALRISEVMANPAAVPDNAGEWIELFNAGAAAVNLQGWVLADLDHDAYVIPTDYWLAPGAYVVLARNGDPAANGGVPVQMVFAGLQFANEQDEVILTAPWGVEVDRLVWGAPGVVMPEGASLERSAFDPSGAWGGAWASWPGSAGDRGSPGVAYAPPPVIATPTTQATALPSATPSATLPPSATPPPPATPTATLPAAWPIVAQPAPLVIDEVQPWGEEGEFIALQNSSGGMLDLSGWAVGDAALPGDSEGIYWLPDGWQLAPGTLFVVARNGAGFRGAWGRAPDAEIDESDAAIPNLPRRSEMGRGGLALNDQGDELLLLNPAGEVADAVAYGDGNAAALGLQGQLHPPRGLSLQRVPGYAFPGARDLRLRFLAGVPEPFAVRGLPSSVRLAPPELEGGMVALWGTLGAGSNFTLDGGAPPHYVLAAAGSMGLDFAAIVDDGVSPPLAIDWQGQPLPIHLPAWRWRTVDGAAAIVYGAPVASLPTWADLDAYLAATGAVAQAQVDEPPMLARIVAVRADAVAAPGSLTALQKGWKVSGQPWLPAGNVTPPLPGLLAGPVRVTGVAATSADLPGILAALAARRGWLASTPGLWLTLRSEAGAWMGETITAGGMLSLQIVYGDRSGQPAGLSLWVDNKVIAQLDLPPAGGRWAVSVPATPGTLIYAVATQADGDFAVTAPLRVVETATMPVGEVERPPDLPGAPTPVGRVEAWQAEKQGDDDQDDEDALPAGEPAVGGQASGPPGSLALAKWNGLERQVEFRAQVIAPPGLFNAAIYVAEPAVLADGTPANTAGLGIQVYLKQGDFAPMQEGDWVLVRGDMHSFRGEMEVITEAPEQVWRYEAGTPLLPLPVTVAEVGETLEGRLVTLRGVVVGWQGESILLADPAQPEAEPVRVTVRSSLDWRRPYVMKGEVWQATGIVSQFARKAPWNGGYRVLVRFQNDLVRLYP